MEITFGKPYWEEADIRQFDQNVPDAEYVWHRDNEDREIEILDGEGWQFQIDKCLPWLLKKGMIFDIKKEEYHRLIKGVTLADFAKQQGEQILTLINRVDKIEDLVKVNNSTVIIINKLFWIVMAAAAAGVAGMFFIQ